MADRPTIFSGPMVRALLAGHKSQTRRVLKLAGRLPEYIGPKGCQDDPKCWGWEMPDLGGYITLEGDEKDHLPGWRNGWRDWQGAYAPGDRLWVREAWRPHYLGDGVWDLDVSYPADGERRRIKDGEFGDRDWNWPKAADRGNVTPIHMPRWASRLTLTVTDVRVQRVQEISNENAIAEGIEPHGHAFTGYGKQADVWMAPYDSFASLWNSIHGPGAWDANPWVAAITFTVRKGNIDHD